MEPLFDYLEEDKENKLSLEMYGELTEDQKVGKTLRLLEDNWGTKRDELLQKPTAQRDPNSYFSVLLYTFRADLYVQFAFRLFQLCLEMWIVFLSQDFFAYLEEDEDPSLAALSLTLENGFGAFFQTFYVKHRGIANLLLILMVKCPKQFVDEKFYNVLCNFLHKIRQTQKCILFNKNLKVSKATNKTISEGKQINIINEDVGRHWGVFWMGAEILKACFVLVMCSYSLCRKVGYAGLLPFVFIGMKMGIDMATRKWRDKTWKNASKAGDARSNEINQAFKNIKTLKLYAW